MDDRLAMSQNPRQRELELLVMPGYDYVACEEARRLGVPAGIRPKISMSDKHAQANVWRWEWHETEIVTRIDAPDMPI